MFRITAEHTTPPYIDPISDALTLGEFAIFRIPSHAYPSRNCHIRGELIDTALLDYVDYDFLSEALHKSARRKHCNISVIYPSDDEEYVIITHESIPKEWHEELVNNYEQHSAGNVYDLILECKKEWFHISPHGDIETMETWEEVERLYPFYSSDIYPGEGTTDLDPADYFDLWPHLN